MATDHNTKISGSLKQLESGRVKINGVTYDIESGNTRVNGSVKAIEFSSTVFITLSGNLSGDYAYMVIGAYQYATATTTEVDSGTSISVYVGGATNARSKCKITLNGTTVKSGYGTYSFTATTASVTIQFTKSGSGTGLYYTAAITTS